MIQLPIESGAIAGFVVRLAFAVTAALLCAVLVSTLSKRFSAALRHKVWSFGIVVSLLIPAMLLVVPERRLGLIGSNGIAIEPTTIVQGSSAPQSKFVSNDVGEPPVENAPVVVATGSAKVPVAVARVRTFSAMTWLCIGWSIPAFLLMARLIWGAIVARAAVRRATTVDLEGNFSRLIADQAPVVLESPAVQSPLCVGWFRSTILLPTNWRAWSRDQLQAVLIHELAHVARRDVLWQAIARLCCALYWPHPLVWYAARRMRIEREFACDDWVVRGGESPTQYARWLLDLACELKAGRTMERLGVAMAGRNGLQTRVQAALDPTRRRTPVSTRLSLLLTVLASILLVVTGTLSPLKAVEPQADRPAAKQTPTDSLPTTEPADEEQPMLRFLAGKVVDEAGHGVAGARVTVPHIGQYTATRDASADAEGRFVVMIEPRKAVMLILRAESRDGTMQTMVRLPPRHRYTQADFENIQLTLKPAAEYPITVTDAGNHPVAGAKIAAAFEQVGSMEVTTDADGKATLRLPAGQPLRFAAARKVDAGFDYVLFARKNAPRVDVSRLASDYVGPIHFVLNGMRTVVVKAVDDKARPLAGVKVSALRLAKPGKGTLVGSYPLDDAPETDSSGTTRVSVPADVDKPVFFASRFGGYEQVGESKWDPKAANDQTKVVLQPMANFHISVVDVNGKPAGGAEVMMVNDNGGQNYGIFENGPIGSGGTSDGMLLSDTYYMFAAMKGQTASDPVMQVIRAGGPPIQIELKLKPGVRVHGHLTAGDPAVPVANHGIFIQYDDGDSYQKLPPDQRLPASAVGPREIHPAVMFNRPTDAQGNFELFLAPGTYHFFDPNQIRRGPLDGQTFIVPANASDMKVDFHYKASLPVIER